MEAPLVAVREARINKSAKPFKPKTKLYMDLNQINELVDKALIADLDGSDVLASVPAEDLQKIYNGCGPEWLHAKVRRILDKFFDVFAPAFLQHDFDFSNGDGNPTLFNEANDRLKRNCLILADRKFPWYNWKRYIARDAALVIADACRQFGWSAYVKASKSKGTL